MIEKLKQNWVAWGGLSSEEKTFLREQIATTIDHGNCMVVNISTKKFPQRLVTVCDTQTSLLEVLLTQTR